MRNTPLDYPAVHFDDQFAAVMNNVPTLKFDPATLLVFAPYATVAERRKVAQDLANHLGTQAKAARARAGVFLAGVFAAAIACGFIGGWLTDRGVFGYGYACIPLFLAAMAAAAYSGSVQARHLPERPLWAAFLRRWDMTGFVCDPNIARNPGDFTVDFMSLYRSGLLDHPGVRDAYWELITVNTESVKGMIRAHALTRYLIRALTAVVSGEQFTETNPAPDADLVDVPMS